MLRRMSPVALLLLLAFALPARAAIDTYAFSSEENATRYHALVAELRCPVCLSSNLAGSDSPISADLRREVYRLVEDGRTDGEVRDYMQSRYGDYVLYRPRLTPFAIALYALPLLLIGVGVFVILRLVRGRRSGANDTAAPRASSTTDADLATLLARHGSPLAGAASGQPSSAEAAAHADDASPAARDSHGMRAGELKGNAAT